MGGWQIFQTRLVSVWIAVLSLSTSVARSNDKAEIQAIVAPYAAALEAGRYAEAESYVAPLLAVAERSDPKVHASGLSLVAELRMRQRRFDDCIALCRQAVQLSEAGNEWSVAALAYFSIANAYRAQLKFKEAISTLEQTIAVCEKHRELESLGRAQSDLAELFEQQSNYAKAEDWYVRALATRQAVYGPDSSEAAINQQQLAGVYDNQGKYTDAVRLSEEATAILVKKLGPSHPHVGVSLFNLGGIYKHQERLREAEQNFRKALSIFEKAYGKEHQQVAVGLGGLGRLYTRQRRFAEAEACLRRALNIYEKTGQEAHLARGLEDLAAVFYGQQRYAEAERLDRRALALEEAVYGPMDRNVARSLHSVGVCVKRQGRYDEAELLYRRSLAICKELYGPRHPEVAALLNFLGTLSEDQGKNAEAIELYNQAVAMRELLQGAEHPDIAAPLLNLAQRYTLDERYAEAEPLVARLVRIEESCGLRPTENDCYAVRASIAWALGRREEAVADLARLLDLTEQDRTNSSGTEQERAQSFAEFGNFYEHMIRWQLELGNTPAAFAAAERSRARTLLDQMAAAQLDLLQGLPPDEAQRLKGNESAAASRVKDLERQLTILTSTKGLTDDHRPRQLELLAGLNEARQQLVDAYADVRNASPAYRQLVGRNFRASDLNAVSQWARENSAVVLHYTLGTKNCYVTVIGGNDPPRIETLSVTDEQAKTLGMEPGALTAEKISPILMREDGAGVLQAMSDPRRSGAATARLAALWRTLIPESCQKTLTGGEVGRLVVIADGPLAMLPFETLVVEAGVDPKYLLDVGPPIVYAPSATVLLNLAQRTKAPQGSGGRLALTVGDPAYQASASIDANALIQATARSRYASTGGPLARLPYSGRESSWVAEVLQKQGYKVGQLKQADASEARVRTGVAGREIVHLACHGLADQEHGNFFGALALTPNLQSIDAANDGFLTLPEISQLDLRRCELAILSACQTNYGPTQRGEGVWALTRGFLIAGSRRVLASNWLVDDEAAASLITVFCRDLANADKGADADYAAALHKAKKWVRQQEKWRSPYYWGTFVLIGPN